MCCLTAAVFAQAQKETGKIHGTIYDPTNTSLRPKFRPGMRPSESPGRPSPLAYRFHFFRPDQHRHVGRACGSLWAD